MSRVRRLLRWAFIAFTLLFLLGAIGLGILYYVVSSKLPDVQSLRNVELQEPLYVYASDGRLIGLFGETRRYPVDIKNVPQPVRQEPAARLDRIEKKIDDMAKNGGMRPGVQQPTRAPRPEPDRAKTYSMPIDGDPFDGRAGRGLILRPGLVLAIEPWVMATTNVLRMDRDGWTLRSRDGSRTAHVEHTVAITEDGPVVMTARG